MIVATIILSCLLLLLTLILVYVHDFRIRTNYTVTWLKLMRNQLEIYPEYEQEATLITDVLIPNTIKWRRRATLMDVLIFPTVALTSMMLAHVHVNGSIPSLLIVINSICISTVVCAAGILRKKKFQLKGDVEGVKVNVNAAKIDNKDFD